MGEPDRGVVGFNESAKAVEVASLPAGGGLGRLILVSTNVCYTGVKQGEGEELRGKG